MSEPKPASRITSLENRASTIEAQVVELSSDQAESLKDLKQDTTEIKKTLDKISEAFVTSAKDTTDIKATMATKDDIAALKTTQDKQGQRQDTMDSKLDQILKLLQQKPSE